jgi:hypothetical protein
LETYNASEGFFAIQTSFTKDDLMLMLDYQVFYEFLSFDDYINGNYSATVPLEGVKKNKNYVIIITTNGGLWRYIIGDTIVFTSLFPHKIKITGRTKYYINVFGEELMEHNVEKALLQVTKKTNSIIKEYTVAPIFMDNNNKGAHEWVIEFEVEPEDMNNFTLLLDEELKKVNSDYEAKRYKDFTLKLPVVHKVPKGTFHKWLAFRGKLGGQNKVPRLTQDRKIIDELLTIN